MVVALNLLVMVLTLGLTWAWWKIKNPLLLLGAAVVLYVYPYLQPSYMPKGDIQRTEVPGFEAKDIPVESRNREPDTTEQRDERMRESVESGLPFNK